MPAQAKANKLNLEDIPTELSGEKGEELATVCTVHETTCASGHVLVAIGHTHNFILHGIVIDN